MSRKRYSRKFEGMGRYIQLHPPGFWLAFILNQK